MKNALPPHVVIFVEPYLKAWAASHFGLPVRLPPSTGEALLLSHLLKSSPRGRPGPPVTTSTAAARLEPLPVIIPHRCTRSGRIFLSHGAAMQLRHAFADLFCLHLWSDCRHLVHSRGALLQGLNEWCRAQGIAIDHREAVRQKFYRLRLSYERNGIILGRKNKHTPRP